MNHGGKNFLAGDVGGTKTLLGLFSVEGRRITFHEQKKYPSKDYPGLTQIIHAFLAQCNGDVNSACSCFGIAGPCGADVCRTRNLPWVVDAAEIRKATGLQKVILINDFEANVYAIPQLPETDLEMLNRGIKDPHGNIAVIGAGTGLGEAFSVYSPLSGQRLVLPSEGGHSDFAPGSDVEIGLLRWLGKKYGHVSFERLLSGEGLVNIYSYLVSTGKYKVSDRLTQAFKDDPDPAAVISEFALDGSPEICVKALDIFVSIYGAEAGNLALKILPYGGVYLAGGIAAKISSRIQAGPFMEAFLNKGRSRELLMKIPVAIIKAPAVGLVGAAVKVAESMKFPAAQN
jgi:glucokinase